MIERIKISNFKSFAEAELRLRPLTVMIGANASGKTNFIEAIGLLAWMARGQPLAHIHSAIRDTELLLRGSPQRLTRYGNNDPIGFEVDVEGDEAVRLELEVALGSNPQVVRERLQVRGASSRAVYEQALNTTTKPLNQPLFTHTPLPTLDDANIAMLRAALTKLSIFQPIPSTMRGYANLDDWHDLRSDGANLSAILENLCQSAHGDQVLEFVRTLPEQDLRAIGFIRVPDREDVMVKLLESFGDQEHWQEAAVLSDGTLRILAIAAALFTSESLLVIEDIDDGVHPSRLGVTVDLLRHHAEERNIKILVTTHNPALLDALPDEELRHVVACYRDPDHGDSRLVELGELDEFPALVAQGPLGQLLTQGLLDRALKHDRGPDQRAAKALEWLDELEAGE